MGLHGAPGALGSTERSVWWWWYRNASMCWGPKGEDGIQRNRGMGVCLWTKLCGLANGGKAKWLRNKNKNTPICIHIHQNTHTHTQTNTHTHRHTHARARTHARKQANTLTHTPITRHKNINMYIYLHTPPLLDPLIESADRVMRDVSTTPIFILKTTSKSAVA